MSEQLNVLIQNYKDGVPVRIERSSIITLCVSAVITVTLCALIVKYIKKL